MRGSIIRAAMFAAYCFVVLVTIGFALSGYGYGFYATLLLGLPATQTNVTVIGALTAVLGAAVGFIAASFAAAVLFLLREIAENTRGLRQSRQFDTRDEAGRSIR